MHMVKRIVNIFLVLLVLGFCACFIKPELASVLESKICLPLRALMSGATSSFAIPIFELLVVCLPILVIVMLARGYITGITTVAKLLIIAYIITLGVPARQPSTLDVQGEYTTGDYEVAARIICDGISSLSQAENYSPSSVVAATMNYAVSALGVDMAESPRVKPTAAPALLTEMGIVAYYAFPTAEIITCTYAPDFMTAFSIAHEAMHFFGITNEDEANLFALAALLKSANESLQYSAYLCAFVYVGSVLCAEDRDTYDEIYAQLPDFARESLDDRNAFLKRGEGKLGSLSDDLNDIAITLRDPRGSESYSHTSSLIVGYLLQ